MTDKLWIPVTLFLFFLCGLYYLLDDSKEYRLLGSVNQTYEDCSYSYIAEEPCEAEK